MADGQVEPAEVGSGRFEDWYPAAWRRIAAAMTSVVGSRSEAEEISSHVTSLAYERWDELRDPTAWAFKTAVNSARRRWRQSLRERFAAERRVDRPVQGPDVQPEVWRAVQGLPTKQRTAIALRYAADLKQNEIADVMGLAPGTVAATLHAARARLREVLKDYNDVTE